MNNEDKILALLEALTTNVGALTVEQQETNRRLSNLETDVATLKRDVATLETKVDHIDATVVRIENVHGDKLDALEDGRKLNYGLIKQVQKDVSRHDEELVFRRIK